jgi:hypothetical protein
MNTDSLGATIATFRTSRIQGRILIVLAIVFLGLSAWIKRVPRGLKKPDRSNQLGQEKVTFISFRLLLLLPTIKAFLDTSRINAARFAKPQAEGAEEKRAALR